MPDINIGALSEAINDKMDRDAQNVDTVSGADCVIEFQVPTADNNYTWYRKYKSGWVEQGGWRQDGDTASSITLMIPMENSNYIINTQMIKPGTTSETGKDVTPRIFNQTSLSFGYRLLVVDGGSGQGSRNWSWQVSGMAQ